jgi:uncharacterized damage-inducible protein DinB
MTEAEKIVDQLERSFRGDPWYGSSVTVVLEGVTATTAASHPIGGAHSIWELVLHLTGWKREVLSRLNGQPAGDPPGGDWPAQPAHPTEAAWRSAVAALTAAHDALVAAVRHATPAHLHAAVRDERNRALGAGLTQWQTLHGLVQHDVYHLGQISLLRNAARA